MNEFDIQTISTRLERLLGQKPVDLKPAAGGYTTAQRWVVTLKDGSSCFIKAPSDIPWTAEALRFEYDKAYSRFETPFLPRLLAFEDDGEAPLLVLEDLSAAHWPPPWTPEQIDALLEALQILHTMPASVSPNLKPFHYADHQAWDAVASDPSAFLSLGLCTSGWLTAALPVLLAAEHAAPFTGNAMIHLDIRSDNLCFAGEM